MRNIKSCCLCYFKTNNIGNMRTVYVWDEEAKAFVDKPIEPEEPALDDKISIGE